MVRYLELSDEEIREIAMRRLRSFPLFDEEHFVQVSRKSENILLIGYRTTRRSPIGTTHLDLQAEGEICYLVDIELENTHRGNGLGKNLYEIAEDIAREIGCLKIIQHASGRTYSGEPRREYVKRKLGYRDIPGTEVEKILQIP